MTKNKLFLFLLVGIALGISLALYLQRDNNNVVKEEVVATSKDKPLQIEEVEPELTDTTVAEAIAEQAEIERKEEEEEKKKEALAAREEIEDKMVESFDNKVDFWMEKTTGGVTVAEVTSFVKEFKELPNARKEDSLRRALNLIPDNNIMLLIGVLMDRNVEKKYTSLIFHDILNRNDTIKKVVLDEIMTDKKHPNRAEAAWILDAASTKSKKK